MPPVEPERMPEEKQTQAPARPATRIAVQTPDGAVRQVELTPEQAREYAWRAAKWTVGGAAALFGLGWFAHSVWDDWSRGRKVRRRRRDEED